MMLSMNAKKTTQSVFETHTISQDLWIEFDWGMWYTWQQILFLHSNIIQLFFFHIFKTKLKIWNQRFVFFLVCYSDICMNTLVNSCSWWCRVCDPNPALSVSQKWLASRVKLMPVAIRSNIGRLQWQVTLVSFLTCAVSSNIVAQIIRNKNHIGRCTMNPAFLRKILLLLATLPTPSEPNDFATRLISENQFKILMSYSKYSLIQCFNIKPKPKATDPIVSWGRNMRWRWAIFPSSMEFGLSW